MKKQKTEEPKQYFLVYNSTYTGFHVEKFSNLKEVQDCLDKLEDNEDTFIDGLFEGIQLEVVKKFVIKKN
jgi:N-formylglutamate amidohydrolase